MKRGLALKQERATVLDASRKIADGEGAMTEEQKATLAANSARVKAIDAELAQLDELAAQIRSEPSATTTTATVPPVAPDENRSRISVSAPNSTLDPKRGYANHRDFLADVMKAGVTGSMPTRLGPLAAAGSDEQGVYSDPHGGFFVPVGVAPGILQVEAEADPIVGLCTAIPMSAPSVAFRARVDKNHSTSVSGGLTVSRVPETVDGTASRAAFEKVTLVANEEVGIAFATETILTDSPESFVAIIQAGFSDEFAANGMKERISGSGTGERFGVLNSPCTISVSKETGQVGGTIVTENIDKMAARSWRYGSSVYLANHNTRPQLKGLIRVVGTGGNAVPYFQSSSNGGPETLDGRPIFFSEFAKSVGTVGDLILGVWSQYLEGTYQGEKFDESIHVRFLARERCFRFYRRNDGRPWWTSALTPKNGDTLSPFVTLATRA